MSLPSIGLGTWKLNGEECVRVINQAFELGYRHVDTADGYGNHKYIGKAIASIPREQIFLTTKVSMRDLLPFQITAAANRFLDELKVDYLDLLLIHWPNPDVNLTESLDRMCELKDQGIIRSIGVSNFVRSHLDSVKSSKFPIATNQIEMHPYLQRKILAQACNDMGIHITAYRPLAKGAFEEDSIMQNIGRKYGKTPSQVALRWLIQQGISVIPKAADIQHLKQNIDVFDFNLTPGDMLQIAELDRGKRYCTPEGLPIFED